MLTLITINVTVNKIKGDYKLQIYFVTCVILLSYHMQVY